MVNFLAHHVAERRHKGNVRRKGAMRIFAIMIWCAILVVTGLDRSHAYDVAAGCSREEFIELFNADWTPDEIIEHCKKQGGVSAVARKYRWWVCRKADGHCQWSRQCAATFADASALNVKGGFSKKWRVEKKRGNPC